MSARNRTFMRLPLVVKQAPTNRNTGASAKVPQRDFGNAAAPDEQATPIGVKAPEQARLRGGRCSTSRMSPHGATWRSSRSGAVRRSAKRCPAPSTRSRRRLSLRSRSSGRRCARRRRRRAWFRASSKRSVELAFEFFAVRVVHAAPVHSRILSPLILFAASCTCLQPVDECPAEGCNAGSIPFKNSCRVFRDFTFCEHRQFCGIAAPDVSCEVIVTQNSRAASDAVCLEERRRQLARGASYDAVAAAQCLAFMRDAGCATQSPNLFPPCARVWTGSKEVGEVCEGYEECRAGAWCDFDSTCPARCVERIATGSIRNPFGCAIGSVGVDQRDGGWVCLLPSPSGAPCQSGIGTPCSEPGDRCAEAADGGVARCLPVLTNPRPAIFSKRGEPCQGAMLIRTCQVGLACRATSTTSGICGDRLTLGEDCSRDPNGCANDLVCDFMETNTCVKQPGLGAMCTSRCLLGFTCLAGRCVQDIPLGQPCDAGACEFGTRCLAGVCSIPTCR